MIPQESPVFVPWNGKMLQGSLISENYMMGMAAVRIPLQGCHHIAHYAHLYPQAQIVLWASLECTNLPFILDILNTMTKETKEIEKMNSKIKKK